MYLQYTFYNIRQYQVSIRLLTLEIHHISIPTNTIINGIQFALYTLINNMQ